MEMPRGDGFIRNILLETFPSTPVSWKSDINSPSYGDCPIYKIEDCMWRPGSNTFSHIPHCVSDAPDMVIRDILKNVLRMRKDMAEIWRCFDNPKGHPNPKNQVCNVNSYRDIMKNVLRMRKDMAKIWGCFDDPMGQPYIQEPSL
ncbi:hypothetical protein AVEN_2807-1 [Araneus ventricosus]|uniref:Uncharacterized protein n=1 Tax=Araneus ventricosus TaxID=182803 RepID=A0A4Y2STA4_ARAVE|nr:hypothetical protein AVEN_186973-1 [Araneus ventricosus]GBN90760.1 hypothetical protein AVEN_2807-1 [Araneus ventricosus]